jgi:hypothetical protein
MGEGERIEVLELLVGMNGKRQLERVVDPVVGDDGGRLRGLRREPPETGQQGKPDGRTSVRGRGARAGLAVGAVRSQ